MAVTLFYTASIAFALGIFARSFLSIGLPEIVWGMVMSLVVGLIWRRRSEASSAPYLLAASIFLFLFSLGALRLEYASWFTAYPSLETYINTEITIEGTIMREPDERETTTHLYVQSDDAMILVIADRFADFEYGDVLTVTGLLSKPEAFETDFGRTFDYAGYLRARGVSYMVQYAEVEVIERDAGNLFLATLFDTKHLFMEQIELLIPEPQVGLGEGLLLGVKRALGDELEQVFRKTGIIHIVVLSGYNIMLVVAFVTFVLSAFLPTRFQLPFGVVSIASFALLVGLSATVVRASIMAILYLIARATNRSYMVVRALMLAGLVMLLINPYLLAFDTGFQLSFVATLGLVLLAPHIERYVSFIPKMAGREFLVATLATQIFVLPILLYQIGEFSVVSVIVNVLVLPMVPVAMLLTFITGVVGFFSTTLAVPIAYLTHLSLTYILEVATFFAALPFASFIVPAFPFWVVPISYGVIGYVVWKLYRKDSVPLDRAEEGELSGWVIEEESVVRKRIAAGERSSPAATETPIFFR